MARTAQKNQPLNAMVADLEAAILRYRSALNLAGGKVAFRRPLMDEAREKARGSLYFATEDLHEVARGVEAIVAKRHGREPGELFDYDTGQVLTGAGRGAARRVSLADDRPVGPWWVVAAERAARKEA